MVRICFVDERGRDCDVYIYLGLYSPCRMGLGVGRSSNCLVWCSMEVCSSWVRGLYSQGCSHRSSLQDYRLIFELNSHVTKQSSEAMYMYTTTIQKTQFNVNVKRGYPKVALKQKRVWYANNPAAA